MSILSKVTGIHISPKHGIHIEPLKALGTALTVGSLGGFGPLAGIAGKVGSAVSHIPGATAIGEGVSNIAHDVAGSGLMSKIGGALKNVGGQLKDQYIDPATGNINFGKVIGTGGAISSMVGQAKQRKSVENYNNADIQQRNDLMSKILASPNYNLPTRGNF